MKSLQHLKDNFLIYFATAVAGFGSYKLQSIDEKMAEFIASNAQVKVAVMNTELRLDRQKDAIVKLQDSDRAQDIAIASLGGSTQRRN